MRNILVLLGLAGVSLVAFAVKPQPQGKAMTPEFYTTEVKPILETNCYACHAGTTHRGGLSMDTRASLLKGGYHGPAIVPGDPDKSLLIQLIGPHGMLDGQPTLMPVPPKTKLTDAEIATLTQWVKAGAVMP